jgi:pyruvate/2-oxoglutarate dehydrogenase complex dihydrolipoamide dehydrogenase (E3) component
LSPDVVVLGAGPAGEVAAGRLGEHGRSVALVERELVGGECSFWACMPSKALLRPGELIAEVRRVPGVREAVRGEIDAGAVLVRRDEVVHHWHDDEQLPWLEERGVELVRGHGRLTGERRVEVGERALEARDAVVVATGSAPAMPPIDGLAEVQPWTNRRGTDAHEVPPSLVVLGGGVVGVELAQAWRTLGAEVTIVEAEDRLLGREEDFAAEHVGEALAGRGVRIRLGAKVVRARRTDGEIVLELEGGDELRGAELLVAVGRRPRTDDLGLEALGLEPGEPLEVDDRLRVPGHPWLYAVGDVNGRAPLTHVGKHQARIAADVICGRDVRDGLADGALAPRVVFTDPQVAAVGHTAASAETAGLRIRVVEHGVGAVAGGSFHGRGEPGTARILIDEDRGVLVGATFTGPEVAEFLHAATIAVTAAVPLAALMAAIPAFPTRSEVWLRLLEKAGL